MQTATLDECLRHDRFRRTVERERDLSTDDIVPAESRLAVPIGADVAESLVRHARDEMPWITADSIAWDIRRLLGDEAGLDLYDLARWILDQDEDDTAPALAWPLFNRPRLASDRLLVDMVDEAVHLGWTAPPDVAAALDGLRDVAASCRTRRDEADFQEQTRIWEEDERARVESAKARIATLEAAANAGWRPNRTPDEGRLWCCLFQFNRFNFLDDLESIITHFEKLNAAVIAACTPTAKDNAMSTPLPNNVVNLRGEPADEIAAPRLRERRVDAASLDGKPVPERAWLVPDWIPARQVTLLYGDGAVGKSLVALQLGAAVVTGSHWFGRPVKQGSVEFISAEDDRDELHIRLAAIARESGQPLATLAGMRVTSLADEDAVLAVMQDGRGALTETPLYHELDEILAESRPALLVLDTLADVFGGNEIVRQQVRAFVNMLRRLAIRYDTTVVVLAHPSLSGMASGKGTSGSTGWSNSVRSRLYFDRVRDDEGREADPDARVLRSMKLNYGPVGTEIRMRWRAGVFVPERLAHGGDPLMVSAKADRVFLELLAKYIGQNRYVGVSPGKSYAPSVFKEDASKEGVSKAHLTDAMERLLAGGRIENAPWGAPSKKLFRLFPVDGRPAIPLPTPC